MKTDQKKTTTILLTLVFTSLPYSAHAVPSISADWFAEWQSDYRTHSDDDAIDGTNNMFLHAEMAPTLRFNDNWYVDGNLVFEPMDQAAELNAGDDIWFDREGGYIEEIKLNYENGAYHLWAGKFNPGFGVAWDWGRGIWSHDFATDYEMTEKVGAGAAYTLETEAMGNYILSATTFFTDTSFLSQSVITQRGQTGSQEGGAGNTGDFSSFTIALDVEKPFSFENLTYHLGFRHQGEQDENRDAATDSENGFVANVHYILEATENLTFDALAEYVSLQNFEGVKENDRDYYSTSVITHLYQNWNVTLGYTRRSIDAVDSDPEFEDDLLQISSGYDFGNGLTAELGYRTADEAGIDTDTIGFLVRYQASF